MVKVEILGIRELQAKLQSLPKKIEKEGRAVIENGAKLWVAGAKRDAPKDYGRLAQSVSYLQAGELKFEIVAQSFQAAYMEFGTKGNYRSIPGTETYAATFKGKGQGDYYDFLNSILDWVKRKGLSDVTNSYTGKRVGGKAAKENQVILAEAIAWSIIRKGVKPHPFFFKQRPIVEPRVEQGLKVVIDSLKL